mmetsp:Transcript_31610/g.58078  ORF Transcript_31610/g.58078 Transcript_31610/m.58078 type:complete len:87 (+) Transcript_31610:973-1233(+)
MTSTIPPDAVSVAPTRPVPLGTGRTCSRLVVSTHNLVLRLVFQPMNSATVIDVIAALVEGAPRLADVACASIRRCSHEVKRIAAVQ